MTAALVVITLLALNALFVAAEFGALGARESRMKGMAASGSRSARLILPFITDVRRLDRYISSCQLGITVTSLALGAYGEFELARRLEPLFDPVAAHSISIAIVLVVLTALQVVLAEQVPKSIALHRPNRVAMITVWPVVACQWLLSWAISFLNASARFFLWAIRAPEVAHRHVHSRQEIDLIIEQSREKGTLEAEKHELLQHVLDLEVVTARQLMVPRQDILALDIEAHVEDGVQLMSEGKHTRMPAYRGNIDDIVGVLHVKDLARHAVEKGQVKDWRKLIRPIPFVNEGMKADRLLTLMREQKTMQAIVMDEFGGVAGLVTLEDVLRHVFGEVGDEFSARADNPERLPDGRVRLPGRLRLDEVEEWVGRPWEGTSTTLGGFITERLGRLPDAGERMTIDGCDVTVERVTNRVVTSVLVRAPKEPSEAGEEVRGHG